MPQKKNVLLLCGGKSAEHEVSIRSAKNVLDALDRSMFNPVVMVLDRENHFFLLKDPSQLHSLSSGEDLGDASAAPAYFLHSSTGAVVAAENGGARHHIYAAFPVMHGPYGEDGSIQGLLEMYGVPYVGCNVYASALAMNKIEFKHAVADVPFVAITEFFAVNARDDEHDDYARVRDELGNCDVFVKPACMGSSVGISKARNAREYKAAVAEALQYDSDLIVEQAVPNAREIEVAVLQYKDQTIVSEPGELIPSHEFYTYEAKYLDPNGAKIITRASLDKDLADYIKSVAELVFQVLGGKGMARIDFFLDAEEKVFLNEVNTIPGFTNISMFPMMMKEIGIEYPELITKLLESAVYNHEQRRRLKTTPDIAHLQGAAKAILQK